MPNLDALRIDPTDRVLSPQQKRFNTLVRQIEQARASLKAWQDGSAQYGESYVRLLMPLQAQVRAAHRQWIFALQALIGRRGWTRAEREMMIDLVCEVAGELLAGGDDDAELKALFAQHAGEDFDTQRAQALDALWDVAESMTGLDLGERDGSASEEDLLLRFQQGMRQRAASADSQFEAKASKPRRTAAQRRQEDEAQRATQSVREIFRKLASALHPDRETDARQREVKTALMQEVNQAYASKDLLALLELQLRIEQVDAGHMAEADAERVKHYNKVLTDQLDELRVQLARAEMAFRMDFGLERGYGLNPQKLGLLLQRQTRHLQAEQAQAQREMRMFDDAAATKRWLKVQLQELRDAAAEMDFF